MMCGDTFALPAPDPDRRRVYDSEFFKRNKVSPSLLKSMFR